MCSLFNDISLKFQIQLDKASITKKNYELLFCIVSSGDGLVLSVYNLTGNCCLRCLCPLIAVLSESLSWSDRV
jgi:hypothetical protein